MKKYRLEISGRFSIKRIIAVLMASICIMAMLVGCGSADESNETTEKKVTNGEVASAEDMSQIGVYVDVDSSDPGVTDVKYSISGDIGIVSFRYNGVKAELRGSGVYDEYELAGVENTSNGDMIVTSVQGCSATFYTLDPGRIAFWSKGAVNFSLYVYVTATDEVLRDIISHVVFDDRFSERADVQEQTAEDSRRFAERVIQVFTSRDLEALEDMMSYPQELGEGQSVANRDELLALNKDDIFTDILLKALSDEKALDELRMTEDKSEYIVGTNYKNVHFKLQSDGSFLITKVNN